MEERRFIGIDLAKRTYVMRIENQSDSFGLTICGKTDTAGIEKMLGNINKSDQVAFEAGTQTFNLARLIISRKGCLVHVFNPWKLAIIFKSTKKTDFEDARKLTWLLKRFPVEELPTVNLPSKKEEERRMLISERISKKKLRNKLINRLHSLFFREGITHIMRKDVIIPNNRNRVILSLQGRTQSEAKRILEEIDLLERHISLIDKEIKEDLQKDPIAVNLLTIPGVGITTAMTYLAHIGDGSRFDSGQHVSSYVGITPRVDNSGDTIRMGSITKRGCVAIRGIIIQSAWAAVHAKKPNRFQKKYQELMIRRGKARAIVAIARRILEMMWIVGSRQIWYNETSKEDLIKKLTRLGLMDMTKQVLGEPAA